MIARGLANPLSPPHLCDWVFETLMTNPGHSLFATVLPLRSTRTRPKERSKNGRNSINMNTQMGSSLPREKLDWSNYSSWEYKMNQFLVHQGHWSYNKAAKAQNRERTKPRRHKAAKAHIYTYMTFGLFTHVSLPIGRTDGNWVLDHPVLPIFSSGGTCFPTVL